MLSPKTQTNLKNAETYFEEHLCAGDYYTEENRVQGEWIGLGAAQLGLTGKVRKEDFLALCENRDPESGERLTQRQNSVRHNAFSDGEQANRRVFYDFTFSPPKSVSVAGLLAGDERIVAAHGAAVKAALRELEQFAAARVRGAGRNSDRRTENIVAALFEHNTSRALDPHLHTHCIVFNATRDADGRWKALQNYEMLSAQKYVENVYYHELARALRGFGYTVVNSARGDFQIAGIAPALCKRFSKRHQEIDDATRAFLAAHPDKSGGNENAIRENIAHKTRSAKTASPDGAALREFWIKQISAEELASISVPKPGSYEADPQFTSAAAVDWAENHLFERHSVVREHELWRHAMAFARGSPFSATDIQKETAARAYIREGDKIAHREGLAREWAIVSAARDGIGRYATFSQMTPQDSALAPDQVRSLAFILASRNFITLFRGGAGTGKSFVLRRVREALKDNGATPVVLAPQRQQALDMVRDGLENTQTVSEFLQRRRLDPGTTVIVDEAGQIGGRQLLDLVQLVQEHQGRLILSGDTRQHGPVEASDALRAIERYSGLQAAELDEIRRQDPTKGKSKEERERILHYRKAVEAAAAGDHSKSFQCLEEMGAVVECGAGELSERLTDAYMGIIESGESVVVVSQTRAEIQQINEHIRVRLRSQGRLAKEETPVLSLQQVDLTAAQKRDQRHYSKDSIFVFNRDYRGRRRGDQGHFVGLTGKGIVLDVDGKICRVPFSEVDRLTVCRAESLSLCAGDRLQLKANGFALDGRQIANGEVVTITGIDSSGTIKLDDGRILPAGYRQFLRGYAVTSYGSQGKTEDHVLFSDSAVRAATNDQQWYVTISRGRTSIQIFTPDKEQLRRAVNRSGGRDLALDLVKLPRRNRRVREQMLRGVKRGRELARRLAMLATRAWIWSRLKNAPVKHHDKSIRNRQTNRAGNTDMLAP